MRILKRLSLHSALGRTIRPRNTEPLLKRSWYKRIYEQKLLVSEELSKYGYASKPSMNPIKVIIMCFCGLLGMALHFYLINLYKNELRVRNPYRLEEKEHSSIVLHIRRKIFNFTEFIERNLFFGQLMLNSKPKKVFQTTEQILRAEQYRNYMAKRDPKYDFMDLGVLDKFPFPELES